MSVTTQQITDLLADLAPSAQNPARPTATQPLDFANKVTINPVDEIGISILSAVETVLADFVTQLPAELTLSFTSISFSERSVRVQGSWSFFGQVNNDRGAVREVSANLEALLRECVKAVVEP